MKNKWIHILRKITRIWSVVVIALGLFIFVGHIFENSETMLEPYPWWENLMPISMLLAIIGLAIGWRWEAIGGALAIGFCLINILLYIATGREQLGAVLLIVLPVFLPGLIFLFCWQQTTRSQPSQTAG